MSNNDVVKVVSALKAEWTGELGFHSHNNKGLAVSNSLTAIDNGVTWIDSTILGMGRGAGNAQTEYLLLELSDKYQMDYYPEALFELVLSDFTMLHNKYRWGASLLYSLAAMNSIHPTYIQKMLSDDCYSNREVLQAIDFMSTVDSSHYKEDLLLTPCNTTESTGTWDAEDWCLKKKVLILGSGEGAVKYQDAIIQYIDIHNPIVISLNIFKSFPAKLIDIYASSNEAKILRDYSFYNKLNKPIVAPRVLIDKIISRHRDIPNLLDYGLNIKKDTFGINKNNCILPYELSIGYVLSFVNAGGAKEIFVVGFDGYSSNDIRQIKINELFELYYEQNLISVVSLTPTTYNIKQDSIYNIN